MLELERIARILDGKGYQVGARIIKGVSKTLFDGNLIPETIEFPPVYRATEFFERKMTEMLGNGEISQGSCIEAKVKLSNLHYPENSLLILALPTRIVNALLRGKVQTLSDLRGLLDQNLTISIRNIGPSCEAIIRERISEFDAYLLGNNFPKK